MKTVESKYTLVVVNLQYGDTESQGDQQARLKSRIDQITAPGVAICRYMFLFDTHRDYDNIQQAVSLFQKERRTTALLPIESELHLVCDLPTVERIAEAFPELKVFRVATLVER